MLRNIGAHCLEWWMDDVGMEDAMSESTLAYLLGPSVMVIICAALWIAAHQHHKSLDREPRARRLRWLDTYHGDWRHRH
jgi:hypothetical protein